VTPGGRFGQVAWEDPTHVLATVFELGAASACPRACRGHWAIVRLGLHGSVNLAAPLVHGLIDLWAYSLPLT
jgi:hypothetical protein